LLLLYFFKLTNAVPADTILLDRPILWSTTQFQLTAIA